MEKKSDTPERIDEVLIQMSHEVISEIAVAIHKALEDAEKGKDEFDAIQKNHPKKKVEKSLQKGYVKASKIIDDEFPEEEEEPAPAPETSRSNKGTAVAVGVALALGMETRNKLTNAVHNPVIVTEKRYFRRFESPSRYYERTVSNAIKDVLEGNLTHEKAVKQAVRELTRSGLRMVDYQSGWANRTNVAVRRAVTTEITHDMAERTFANADAIGTQLFEVEYHDGARPEHAEWQGKVYTEQELYDICGLGEVDGLCGANCYHYFYPYIEGSQRLYTDEFLAEKLKESKQTTPYQGKEYTPYNAKQKMRQMESAMRIQREKIDILNRTGQDAVTDRAKYKAQRREYEKFAGAMNQKTDYRRVYQDGLGRV
jgi:hypothetical protein